MAAINTQLNNFIMSKITRAEFEAHKAEVQALNKRVAILTDMQKAADKKKGIQFKTPSRPNIQPRTELERRSYILKVGKNYLHTVHETYALGESAKAINNRLKRELKAMRR